MDLQDCKRKMEALGCCVIVPTYNNEKTLEKVLRDVQQYCKDILVVNDGSTDSTTSILSGMEEVKTISYEKNVGKGNALNLGLKWAFENGFSYAITIDSDGQHFADDIPVFIEAMEATPGAFFIGCRNLREENMPKKNTFGNKFSNFWFKVETGITLPDTQSGYRLYPLEAFDTLFLFTKKYEYELEIMVKLAWKEVPIKAVPVKVHYPKGEERVTHFRPIWDFVRIGYLNTYLVTLAFLWHTPKRFIKSINKDSVKTFVKKNFFNSEESVKSIVLSVSFGVFMGVIPIWGYQLAAALILAHFFKLNKAMVALAANISIPPFIPFILYGSLKTGQWILNRPSNIFKEEISLENVKNHLIEYLIGSVVFAVVLALVFGLLAFVIVTLKRSRRKS